MRLSIINGPNLNFLGIREPDIYGKTTYHDLLQMLQDHADQLSIEICCMQSNHEGDLVDAIQAAYGTCDGIILNPGAYTHTSIALLDALKAVGLPAVEVHISDINTREAFRQISYIRPACIASIIGHGLHGYVEAMDLLVRRLSSPESETSYPAK